MDEVGEAVPCWVVVLRGSGGFGVGLVACGVFGRQIGVEGVQWGRSALGPFSSWSAVIWAVPVVEVEDDAGEEGVELHDGVIRIGSRSYMLDEYKAFKRGFVSDIDMILLVPRKWYAAHYGYVDLSEDEAENMRLVKALKAYGLDEREYRDDWADRLVRKIGL